MKSLRGLIVSVAILCLATFCWPQQNNNQDSRQNSASFDNNAVQLVARSTKAIDYRHGSKSEIGFQGTDLSPEVAGKAEVEAKGTNRQIKAQVDHLRPANSFGLQYLTYVLWAISPEGAPINLGELDVKDGKGEIRASTSLQAFALVVTAEPYFAVSQPSDELVAVNQPGPKAEGAVREIDVTYKALPGRLYVSQSEPIENPVYGIDKNVPTSLKEARNAVRIAKLAGATQYANGALQHAEQLLAQADGRRSVEDLLPAAPSGRDAEAIVDELLVLWSSRLVRLRPSGTPAYGPSETRVSADTADHPFPASGRA